MKKIFLTLGFALSVFASEVIAKDLNGVLTYSPIVTPDVATGARIFPYLNDDTGGEMLVCNNNDFDMGSCKGKGWVPIRQVVPNGKIYVGFRIIRITRNRHLDFVEVYWK